MYRFLIYISYSYALPIGEPLEREIIKRGYRVNWFADEVEGKTSLSHKSNNLETVNDMVDYDPHIVLTISDIVPDFIPGLKVQIFHGFLAQKRLDRNNQFSHFRMRGFFDLYCTQGPSTTDVFNLLAKKHNYFEVVETGWSKVDPIFPLENKTVSDKPVILIASTFTPRLSLAFDLSVYDEIKKLSNTGIYQFLMVLHPKIDKEIRKKWKLLENENFTFHDTTELIPLFKKSDIMFSDNTSAIQEYLIQEKPVVVFNHIYDHEYLLHVHNSEDIEKAFSEALKYPAELLVKIKEFVRELHPYYDGNSSKRVIDACIAQLHKEKSNLREKPFNLIRKYKIRKRLNYFTLKSFNKPFTLKREEIIKD